MEDKLLITKLEEGILTTLLENGKVVEFRYEPLQTEISLGNIYIGKVKKIVKNIQAAFIEIEKGRECYYSIEDNADPIFTKKSVSNQLVAGDELLVQVSREGTGSKVPTVTSHLNFTGKYVVLTWGKTRIGVSGKILPEEKVRLRSLLEPFKNDKFGLIIRTNAMQAKEEEIIHEAEALKKRCLDMIQKAEYRACFSLMNQDARAYLSSLRDAYTDELTEILTDDKQLYEEMQKYLSQYQPEDLKLLNKYEDALLPLAKLYNLQGNLTAALRDKVWLKSGAYLIIQPTEALTVIDVNTGKYVGKKKNTQDTFLKINLEAAKETARQVRLRNISGIIIIDFINLDRQEDKDTLMEYLSSCLKKDPIKTVLIDMTPLNLVEITRKKVRRPLYEQLKISNETVDLF